MGTEQTTMQKTSLFSVMTVTGIITGMNYQNGRQGLKQKESVKPSH
jgi:hypothetical protein